MPPLLYRCSHCQSPMEQRLLMCQLCWDTLSLEEKASHHYWAAELTRQLAESWHQPTRRQVSP